MGRVGALADREGGFRPPAAKPYHSLVPLVEVLGELLGTGPSSGRVRQAYERLVGRVGPELVVLTASPGEDLSRVGPPLLDEALRRMRSGAVKVAPGYDGEYGVVRLFDAEERRRLLAQTSFAFSAPAAGAAEPVPPYPSPTAVPVPAAKPVRRPPAGPNAAQARVVEHGEGPLLVVAGPGTGKTRTIAERIAVLAGRGVSARAITAVTFTRKAAGELRERLVAGLAGESQAVSVVTFHALGIQLLRAFPGPAGLPPAFTLVDEEERRRLIDVAAAEGGWDQGSSRASPKASEAISRVKAELLGPEQVAPALAGTYRAYERALAARGAVDFDDLVGRAVRLLETSAEAREAARERARYLFVDEYQDINTAQHRLVKLLAPPDSRPNLCAVGDPDQAIYGFRGADPSTFARFEAEFPGTTVVTLSRNYRSTAQVVRGATEIIARSAGRAPRALVASEAQGEGGAPVERAVVADERAEADFLAAEIERAVGGTSLESIGAGRGDGNADGALAFHDIAVLVRLQAQADAIADAFSHAGIPFQRAGTDNGPPSDVEITPQKVALLTLHASKGLEFPLVFIAGCEDGLLPLWLPGRPPSDAEEERRLLYVGMTRAKARLVLTCARRRTLYGRTIETRPCPFLRDLPADLFAERRARPRKARQLSLL